MLRFALPLAILALLSGFFFRGLYLSPGYVPSPFIGKPAPEFRIASLTDPKTELTSHDMLGSVALFNVWGTWCGGCRAEHEFLMQISEQTRIPIYGLDWKDDRGSALTWLAQLGNPYTISGFDAAGTVAIDWGVYGAPETFLMTADGTVLYKHIAALTPEIWEQEFVPRIRAQCGEDPCPLLGDR
jgi:cytochrome c biogenesis protein CcmG/thiol:disulfide interchange protein DsbE